MRSLKRYVRYSNAIRLALAVTLAGLLALISACSNPFSISSIQSTLATAGDALTPAPPVVPPTTSLTLTVQKVYPTNGAAWLQFISGSTGSTLFDRNDTACAGSETGTLQACIHGGDKLKVVLSDYSSCNNLELTDSLGVFNWVCFVQTGHAVFYSAGFNENKGLSDLIDFSGHDWKNLQVTLLESQVQKGQSTLQKWWSTATNPIATLPYSAVATQTITGYTAGTILVLEASQTSRGYTVDQDSLAIVTDPSATLSLSATTAQNCDYHAGESAGANSITLFCIGSQKYLWFEGNFNDPSHASEPFIALVNTKFSYFNKFKMNAGAAGNVFYSIDSSYNRFQYFRIQNVDCTWATLDFYNSHYNYLYDFKIANNITTTYWPFIQVNVDSTNNVLTKATFSQTNYNPISIFGANNTITDVIATSASRVAVGGTKNTISHLSTYLMGNAGLVIAPEWAGSASFNTANQILASDNYFGAGFVDSTNTLASQYATFMTFDYMSGYYLNNTSNNKFTNNFIMSSSSRASVCDVSGGANPGLVNGTCNNQGTSDAIKTIYDQTLILSPIAGLIASNDLTNTSDNGSGIAIASSITDFLNFDNRFRAWGEVSLGFTACSGMATCSIVDLRLKASDMTFRNTSFDGASQNTAFVANTTCPAAVHGNKALTDQSDAAKTFLINAQEIINDGIGNDNGLCESNETCIYSPNFGAYQGHGDYKTQGTCNFQNGSVSNVIMYAYPINGI